MAVEFTVPGTRGTEYLFFPEEIEIREDLNGRHVLPDIEWLINDILRHGQIEPVPIWNDGGKPVLIAGFSRWRALSEINKRKLALKPQQIRCTYRKTNERGAFLMNISENRMRNATTPVDDAHNIQRLINTYQFSEEEAAKIYFPAAKSETEMKAAKKFIAEHLAMVTLTPEAETALKDGRMKSPAAAAIAKMSATQQREFLKAHPEGRITTKDVKGAAPVKPGKPAKVKRPKIAPELLSKIMAVLETADWENFDEKKSLRIEVQAEELAALKNYLSEPV